ncbi:hypothetical protein [Nitratidesulfovibrio vulgaris]|jgi:hypothetical protein|uniref:Uncharacterized protein n=2 Tax=Nitratidesulfovibrio vulgaris TaxID=881 RepID=Q725Z1_NITV2|nr:hypothetical protein [Nitratidesulfovibrio vulgaris]GEB78757.1 hypothetical protein DDE01_01720 [Desulfovibrio desulfuricans]HBW15020.1 hypothetical protein [Desulfovibrio sp.]AAS97752.1 hypothetical protein DVU_3283 [Nitratidesulfovibrio vulgaris str. Hildenborough]ABM27131.1 conserved hypothetical protein [Nitratidesulfovibrio vulgaris DP4]ADP88178.1 hypothetical protein Deval_3037 [Nitratidesulfovibrio vulgaris RCH1]
MSNRPTDPVYPDISDDDLWLHILADLDAFYGDRFNLDQKRQAFTKTCEAFDDYVPLERFTKRVRVNCVWNRRIDLDA